LRATCPSEAMMVKGIQSVAVLNMSGGFGWRAGACQTAPSAITM
jgi:hypothetical protein